MDYYGYNNYGYADFDTSAVAGLLGGLAIFIIIISLISLAASIVYIIGLWKMFKKAGKGGWESIIPFYNNWVLVEISGLNWWWFLFSFAPLVLAPIGLSWLGSLASIFANFNCFYNIAKKFNKGTGFAVCLTIFTPICVPILGLSKNNIYDNNVMVSKNGVINDSQEAGNNNVNNNYQSNTYSQNVYNNTGVTPANTSQNNSMNSTEDSASSTEVNNQVVQEFSFCGNCGTKLDKNTRFCPNCGKQNI